MCQLSRRRVGSEHVDAQRVGRFVAAIATWVAADREPATEEVIHCLLTIVPARVAVASRATPTERTGDPSPLGLSIVGSIVARAAAGPATFFGLVFPHMNDMDSPRHRASAASAVLLSWSGGKDSALALQALRADPNVTVTGLVTTVTAGYDRISIHGVRRSLLHAQAASLGLPLHEVVIEPACSNDAYEAAFCGALAALEGAPESARTIAFGDLFLQDVRAYRERLLARTAFRPLFPLWEQPTAALAERFIDDGFAARLVCVDTTQIDGALAGRPFDRALLRDLPASADPCGERGEFHTFVSEGPGFRAPVPYSTGETVLRDDRFMYCELLPA